MRSELDLEIEKHEGSLKGMESPLQGITVRRLRKTVTGFACVGIAVLMSALNFGAVKLQPPGILNLPDEVGAKRVALMAEFWSWVVHHSGSGDCSGCSSSPSVLGVRG